ncbi:DNA polymerase-like protein [Tanacetum coccineum]
MSLCPDLGTKGSVDHESVNEKSPEKDKEVLIEYMKKDILLLGGVMQKAQNIYWKLYQLDIESKITLSSLALNIFRLRYYNDEIFPIHIPNQNEDTFIRKAYYGGHTDSYKPYDSN